MLSPSLFNVYLDDRELLIGLRSCGYWARIGHMYVGSVAYADDVTLLSPTLHEMQKMLDVCSLFAEEKGLIFNSKKSVSTVFVWNSRSLFVRNWRISFFIPSWHLMVAFSHSNQTYRI